MSLAAARASSANLSRRLQMKQGAASDFAESPWQTLHKLPAPIANPSKVQKFLPRWESRRKPLAAQDQGRQPRSIGFLPGRDNRKPGFDSAAVLAFQTRFALCPPSSV